MAVGAVDASCAMCGPDTKLNHIWLFPSLTIATAETERRVLTWWTYFTQYMRLSRILDRLFIYFLNDRYRLGPIL